MNLFFLLILYPTILLKHQGSVWVLRKADATVELHMREIYWEVPGRGNGKEEWARRAFRSCCRYDSSKTSFSQCFPLSEKHRVLCACILFINVESIHRDDMVAGFCLCFIFPRFSLSSRFH